MIAVLFITLLLERLIELRMHVLHERQLIGLDVVKSKSRYFEALWYWEFIAVLAIFSEYLWLGAGGLPLNQVRVIALVMMAGGFLLKCYAQFIVGGLWTLRLYWIKDYKVMLSGPYRWLNHPEYLARFLEIFGLSLFLGSYFSFLLYLGGIMLILPGLLREELALRGKLN